METRSCSKIALSRGEDRCSCVHRPGNLWSGIRIRPSLLFVWFLNPLSVWLSSSCWFDPYWDFNTHGPGNILFVNVHVTMWDFRFSQRCCWRFKTSRMLHCSAFWMMVVPSHSGWSSPTRESTLVWCVFHCYCKYRSAVTTITEL